MAVRFVAGRLLTVETISVPAMSDGHVIPGLTRWTEMVDVDRSYAFVLRLFYDSKDLSAGRLYGANRLTVGLYYRQFNLLLLLIIIIYLLHYR